MTIPKYDDLFNPLLEALHNLEGSSKIKKIEKEVARILNLNEEEAKEIHRGNRTKLAYRLAWASNYLKRYGLIDKSIRGVWTLTDKGKQTKSVDKSDVNKIVKQLDQNASSLRKIKGKIETIEIKSFLNKINLDDFKYDPHFLKNPGVRVKDIISNIQKNWVLPNFQRYYDWKKEDVRAFLESIFKDYFVGSLLLWDVEGDPGIAHFPIFGVTEKIEKPDIIILDGQQRITSLYYAIKAPTLEKDNINSYFYISFKNFFENKSKDLVVISKRKYTIEESVKLLLFPFYELENQIAWIREFEDFYEKQDIDRRKLKDMTRIMQDRLLHFWNNFQIPDIKLPSTMKLHHVVDIFENINTKGKLLDAFDLLIAASSKHNIDLRKLWEGSCKKYPEFNRYAKKTRNKLRMYIIQAISLLYNPTSSCKKSDILEIYDQVYDVDIGKDPKIFETHWDEMSRCVYLAIKKLEDLKDGFGVIDENHVPFMPTIPILAALIKQVEKRENKYECNKKIKEWYWSIIFSEAYSSAVDSQLTSDFKEMNSWFSDNSKVPENIESARNNISNLNLRKIGSFSSAIYKGILSLLALEGSRDLQTGEMVSERDNYHKDHLFPKSKSKNYTSSRKDIDSILNMTWLTNETNLAKGAKDPKDYFALFLKKYKGNNGDYIKVLKSHFMNKVCLKSLLENNFKEFCKEKDSILLKEIKGKIGWSEEDDLEEEHFDINSLLSSYEHEKLEFKSTFKKNLDTQKSDDVMKFSILKTIVGFLNSLGGTLVIGYNEKNEKIIGIEEDFDLIKSKDRDGWELEFWSFIESKINTELSKKNINLRFEKFENKSIAVIEVKRSDNPIFIKKKDKKILYVRNRNKTDFFDDPEKIHKYIDNHF
jgi:hypothetical protein